MRLSAAVLLAAALAGSAEAADFRLDDALVTGSGKQIALSRLPFVQADGSVVYRDVTITLGVGPGNTVTVVGTPRTTASVDLLGGALTPGRYRVSGASPELVMRLVGPAQGANNRPMWSLIGEKVGQQMNFYTGGFKGHPLQKRIERAAIVWSGQAFGSTSRNTSLDGWYFDERQLVAIQPLGRAISLMSYSYNGADATYPLRTVTLLPCDATACK